MIKMPIEEASKFQESRWQDLLLNKEFTQFITVTFKEDYRKLDTYQREKILFNKFTESIKQTNALNLTPIKLKWQNIGFYIQEEDAPNNPHFHILLDLSFYLEQVQKSFLNFLKLRYEGTHSFDPIIGRIDIKELKNVTKKDYEIQVMYASKLFRSTESDEVICNDYFKANSALKEKIKLVARQQGQVLQWIKINPKLVPENARHRQSQVQGLDIPPSSARCALQFEAA